MAEENAKVPELVQLIRESAPEVHNGRNVSVRHVKGEEGSRGFALLLVDLDASNGPSGSGLNISVGTLGRNVPVPEFGGVTVGCNFFRPARTAEERAACATQVENALALKALQDKLKAGRG